MLPLRPLERRERLSQAIAQALTEETRKLRAESRRLVEHATELMLEARALRAQRPLIRAVTFEPRPSGI